MKTMRWTILALMLAMLAACNGSDNDSAFSSAPSEATAVAALRAQVSALQGQITTIQGELPHNLIVARGTSAFGMRTMAVGNLSAAPNATTAATFTATFLGPPTGNIFGMTQQIGMSTTNYLFISDADGAVESAAMPVTIFYEAPNCQGPAFTVLAAGLSSANIKQGVVFGTGKTGDNVAADYLMLKAGTLAVPDFANSELQAIPGNPTCVNVNPGPSNFPSTYPLVQNDPVVSGVPSGPFSPTTLGP